MAEDLRSSRALLRRIDDAERLVRVEEQTKALSTTTGRLEAAMQEHAKASADRQEAVMKAIGSMSKDLNKTLDDRLALVHARHNALVKKFYWLAGLTSAGAASAAKYGGHVLDLIFGGPASPK